MNELEEKWKDPMYSSFAKSLSLAAINHLKNIKSNDDEKEFALLFVKKWIDKKNISKYQNTNKNKTSNLEYKSSLNKTIDIIFNNALMSMPEEKNLHTSWVKSIINELVNIDDMTNKDIKEALERHGVKTARGLDSWAIGTVGTYVAEIRKNKFKKSLS